MKIKINKQKTISAAIFILMILPMISTAATPQKATTARDIIGNPVDTFNQLPPNVRSAILLVTGLLFLGAMICVVYATLASIGKTTIGTTHHNAKMKSQGIESLILIVAVVFIGIIVLALVFWYFTPNSI